jgi:aminomethyltransferase
MRETVLTPLHARLGARLVPFAGWRMPVQYTGILDEVRLVRERAGLFDLCHMGRVAVRGRGAVAFLQRLQTNDVERMAPGAIRYSLILDEAGATQDDILVYREPHDDGWFLVVNAANTERDLAIMRDVARGFDVQIDDQTDALGMFAIQGPASVAIAQELTDRDLAALRYYHWLRGPVAGVDAALSRTGYTGEDGFEVYAPPAALPGIWEAFLRAGEAHGLLPAGLGSRDTLRLEAGMALYGHEIDERTNPLEAGLGWAVKFTHDFIGRASLERIQAAGGTGRRLVGLKTDSRRVPRQGYAVWSADREVGEVRSGTASPTLQTNIATAYVADDCAAPGTALAFAVRDQREPATVAPLPFYSRKR